MVLWTLNRQAKIFLRICNSYPINQLEPNLTYFRNRFVPSDFFFLFRFLRSTVIFLQLSTNRRKQLTLTGLGDMDNFLMPFKYYRLQVISSDINPYQIMIRYWMKQILFFAETLIFGIIGKIWSVSLNWCQSYSGTGFFNTKFIVLSCLY